MKTLRLMAAVAIAAALLPVSFLHPAFADATTTVQVPIGEWLGSATTVILSLTSVAFVWLCRFLPGYAVSMMKTFGVEQLLRNAVSKANADSAGITCVALCCKKNSAAG